MSGPLARLLGPLALLAPLALAAQPAGPVPTPAAAPVPGDQLTLTEAVLLAEGVGALLLPLLRRLAISMSAIVYLVSKSK